MKVSQKNSLLILLSKFIELDATVWSIIYHLYSSRPWVKVYTNNHRVAQRLDAVYHSTFDAPSHCTHLWSCDHALFFWDRNDHMKQAIEASMRMGVRRIVFGLTKEGLIRIPASSPVTA